MAEEDEGAVDLKIVGQFVLILAGLIPGSGAEKDLKKAVVHLLKFLNARSDAIDSIFDIDG